MVPSLHQVFYYTFPCLSLGYFILTYTAASLYEQPAKNTILGSRLSRPWLITLFSFVAVFHVVEAVSLLISDQGRLLEFKDVAVAARLIYAADAAYQSGQLYALERPCRSPFRGSWLIGLLADAAFLLVSFTDRSVMLRGFQRITSVFRILLLSALRFGSGRASLPSTDNKHGVLSAGKSGLSPDHDLGSDDDASPTPSSQQQQQQEDQPGHPDSFIQFFMKYSCFFPIVGQKTDLHLVLRAIGVAMCLLVSRALGMAIPHQTANVVDALNGDHGGQPPWAHVVVLLVLVGASSSFGVSMLQDKLMSPIESQYREQTSRRVYAHMLHLSADFHSARDIAQTLNAISTGHNLYALLEQIVLNVLPMGVDLVLAISYLSAVFGPFAMLITSATGLLLITQVQHHMRMSRERMRAHSKYVVDEHGARLTGLLGWFIVAAHNRVDYEVARHDKAVTARYRSENKYNNDSRCSAAKQSLILWFGLAASTAHAVYKVWTNQLSTGQYTMLVVYWTQVAGSLQFFTGISQKIRDQVIQLDDLLEIMHTKAEIQSPPSAPDFHFRKGEVEFEGVGFSYKSKRDILNQVRLSIRGGQTVALVGPSGTGKTTMLQLLNRFYDVTEGKVLIDGQDVREVKLESLREHIGYIAQDSELFPDTIMNNVRYGNPEASYDQVVEACRAARIHDTIVNFEDGYDTKVGYAAKTLSGGERQRIIIARIILRNPKMILLDEATSALDTETEVEIQESLRKLCQGRTTVIIAHRLSTIMGADIIAVLDKGTIIETGNHDELLKKGGKYSTLWQLQFQNHQSKDEPEEPKEPREKKEKKEG